MGLPGVRTLLIRSYFITSFITGSRGPPCIIWRTYSGGEPQHFNLNSSPEHAGSGEVSDTFPLRNGYFRGANCFFILSRMGIQGNPPNPPGFSRFFWPYQGILNHRSPVTSSYFWAFGGGAFSHNHGSGKIIQNDKNKANIGWTHFPLWMTMGGKLLGCPWYLVNGL